VDELRLIDNTAEPTSEAQDTASAGGAQPEPAGAARSSSRPDDLRAVIGGGIAVFLMLFWAVDDGGFDPGTWYWGALLALAALAGVLAVTRGVVTAMPRALKIAIACFALYVAWSYLSMTWAPYAGLALQGSNRALLYLIFFGLMAVLPWRRTTALLMLVVFACGIGVIAFVLLFRFALGSHVDSLFLNGRLISPTGYINSTAALFTVGALVAVAVGAQRALPGPLRGFLLAAAAADLMMATTVQSRGWLFTLPIVGLFVALLAGERLRTAVVALLPAAGTLIAIKPMLKVYLLNEPALTRAAIHAGKIGLLSCAGVFAVGTLAAWVESARDRPRLSAAPRRILGTLAVLLAVAGLAGGLVAVSSGHPGSFVSKQWHGFTREPSATNVQSHFAEVGSGRYDIWKAALSAFRAHPIGGLGQDNFGDYYLTHRHTQEEPLWTHSLELRLLAHTGIVGFLLFAGFLAAALAAVLRARRRGSPADRMLVGAALLPLIVWLVHGSIDWFWEVPALSGPALGFLAMAGRLRPAQDGVTDPVARPAPAARSRRIRVPRPALAAGAVVLLLAATVVLGVPYLAVREINIATSASHSDPSASLADFRTAHSLNPLMSDPGILGGTVALINGRDFEASGLFRQALAREPGDWYGWLGRGLAASAQGEVGAARHSYAVALRLNARQAVVQNAVHQVGTKHPLNVTQALAQINYLP
jgi:hypothetical protein